MSWSTNTYELDDGRVLPVAAEHHGHDYAAYVLHEVDAAFPWVLTWTDGINHWLEEWSLPEVAFARLAALVRACDQQVFLVHVVDEVADGDDDGGRAAFEDEAERFLSRAVHASSCQPGCDGTDPANHQV